MSYHDQFEDADVLDSLSWVSMPDAVRIMKLASIFIEKEDDIRGAHRSWPGPTVSNVRPFVKSLYVPPRGQGKATIEMVVKAILYQKRIRCERQQNQPYTPKSAKKRNSEYGLKARIKRVSKRSYRVHYNDADGQRKTRKNNAQAMGVVNGVLLIVDMGSGWSSEEAHCRIYMRHKATGRSKVVVLDPEAEEARPNTIVDALSYIAPEDSVRTMYNGQLMTLNFDEEAFECGGDLWKWRNVQRVYRGKKRPLKTRCKPKKKKE